MDSKKKNETQDYALTAEEEKQTSEITEKMGHLEGIKEENGDLALSLESLSLSNESISKKKQNKKDASFSHQSSVSLNQSTSLNTLCYDEISDESLGFEDTELCYITFVKLVESLYIYGAFSLHLPIYAQTLIRVLKLEPLQINLAINGIWILRDRRVEFLTLSRDPDISKLKRTIQLVREICAHKIGCESVHTQLEDIKKEENFYHWIFKVLMFPIYATGFGMFFFGGNTGTMLLTAGLGLFTGLYYRAIDLGWLHRLAKLHVFINCCGLAIILGFIGHMGWVTPSCIYPAMFGLTAMFFPGSLIVFSVLEMLMGASFIHIGAIRYIYANFVANVIGISITAGLALWTDVIGDNFFARNTATCSPLIQEHEWLRVIFFIFVYLGALVRYKIPFLLYFAFFIVHFTTYFSYFLMSQTVLGSYLACGIAVVILVILSAMLSHPFLRKFILFREMTPVAVIIPAMELLVPGSAMVKMVLSLKSGGSYSEFQLAILYTSLAISIGFLVGEVLLSIFFSNMSGILKGDTLNGPYNHWNPKDARDKEKVLDHLPLHCTEYLVFTIHKGHNLVAADINGTSDPYVQITQKTNKENFVDKSKKKYDLLGKTTTKFSTLNPHWDQAFVIPIEVNAEGIMDLQFEVFDFDFVGSNDKLGKLTMKINLIEKTLQVNEKQTFGLLTLDSDYPPSQFDLKEVKRGQLQMSLLFESVDSAWNENQTFVSNDFTPSADSGPSVNVKTCATAPHALSSNPSRRASTIHRLYSNSRVGVRNTVHAPSRVFQPSLYV